jgi:ribosome maturation factor RimP
MNVGDKIRGLAVETAGELGVELVDVGLFKRGRRHLLRITIDREGGITLDDCEAISRRLEALLDVEDPIPGPYVLEVTSPGLDRPLKSPRDFQRQKGRLLRIVTKEKIGNQSFFVGRLKKADDEGITIVLSGKKGAAEEIEIAYRMISKANLEIEI